MIHETALNCQVSFKWHPCKNDNRTNGLMIVLSLCTDKEYSRGKGMVMKKRQVVRYKGKLIGTQIKGWELDKDDDGNSNNEYPVAMNELGNVMCDNDNSSVSSESSIK